MTYVLFMTSSFTGRVWPGRKVHSILWQAGKSKKIWKGEKVRVIKKNNQIDNSIKWYIILFLIRQGKKTVKFCSNIPKDGCRIYEYLKIWFLSQNTNFWFYKALLNIRTNSAYIDHILLFPSFICQNYTINIELSMYFSSKYYISYILYW